MVAILVHSEIIGDKSLGLLSKMFGQTSDIGICKQGSRSFAAIGTLQAISALELRLMEFLHEIIQIFGRLPFELSEKLFVFALLFRGLLGELSYNIVHPLKNTSKTSEDIAEKAIFAAENGTP